MQAFLGFAPAGGTPQQAPEVGHASQNSGTCLSFIGQHCELEVQVYLLQGRGFCCCTGLDGTDYALTACSPSCRLPRRIHMQTLPACSTSLRQRRRSRELSRQSPRKRRLQTRQMRKPLRLHPSRYPQSLLLKAADHVTAAATTAAVACLQS